MNRVRMIGFSLLCVLAAAGMLASSAWAASGADSWGANTEGQLGNGTNTNFASPTAVNGITEAVSISAGGNHSLAVLANGTVEAWGENNHGQLGNGTTTGSTVPVAVTGITEAVAVSAGNTDSLALLKNGTVMAWGENAHGQLGNGSITNSDVPVAVTGLTGVTAIAAGGSHNLALLSTGAVWAWGDNASGQLGNGATGNGELTPVAVKELSTGVTAIGAGDNHSLAVLAAGTVDAWGENAHGQLGNGTTTSSDVPVAVTGLTEVTKVSGGGFFSMALHGNGTVATWGSNVHGQLGNGTTTASNVPVAVSELTGATAISAGGAHALALLGTGVVKSWGYNFFGQLGTGEPSAGTDLPVEVPGLKGVTAIDAGSFHSLSIGPLLPTVTAVSPKEGAPGGATAVTITGTNLTGATAVKFGTNNATSFKVESSTTISAVSPAGAGDVHVTVTTPEGPSAASPADLFSYLPSVAGVTPNTGPQAGGTTVDITGANLSGATAVKFGTNNATSFKVESGALIVAVSPAGFGVVDVTVTTTGGTSVTSSADQFTYGTLAPEFGRCVRVTPGSGVYGTSGCTSLGGTKTYDWIGGPPPKPKFTTKLKTDTKFLWQSVGGETIECVGEKSGGEYSGPKTVAGVTVTLNGCVLAGAKCTSAAAKEGEVVTKTLQGELGVIKVGTEAAKNEIGLDLKAAPGSNLAEFSCGTLPGIWRGSIIVALKANKNALTQTLKFTEKTGKQKPEAFEGQAKDVIESSLGEAAFEQSGWSLTSTMTNAEKVEVNSVV